jgi:hypothetical protein
MQNIHYTECCEVFTTLHNLSCFEKQTGITYDVCYISFTVSFYQFLKELVVS